MTRVLEFSTGVRFNPFTLEGTWEGKAPRLFVKKQYD